MPRVKSEYHKAVGKLISAIQKEWGEELGESYAEMSENVMNAAHDLLQAGTIEKGKQLLGTMTLRQYLGEIWVIKHPHVNPALTHVEELLKE